MAVAEGVLKPAQKIKPILNEEDVKIMVKNLYGFDCDSIVQLDGYFDVNYKILVKDGGASLEYVCKILNSLESKQLEFLEAQCVLLFHLSSNGIPCQTPLKNKMGKYFSVETLESGNHVVRILNYLSGSVFQQAEPNTRLLFEAGKFIAELDRAAKTFHHQGYKNHKSIWFLENVSDISKFLYALNDNKSKQFVEEAIECFKERVLLVKDELEAGLIHGDFNEYNIIVQKSDGQWHITGILDFGDSHFACYLFELAIAITYMMIAHKNLDAAGYVIAGYSTVRKLTVQEFSLLKVCVAARLCQSLVMGTYSILQDPDNAYIMGSAPTAGKLLLELWPIDEEKILHRWKTIAENYIDV